MLQHANVDTGIRSSAAGLPIGITTSDRAITLRQKDARSGPSSAPERHLRVSDPVRSRSRAPVGVRPIMAGCNKACRGGYGPRPFVRT